MEKDCKNTPTCICSRFLTRPHTQWCFYEAFFSCHSYDLILKNLMWRREAGISRRLCHRRLPLLQLFEMYLTVQSLQEIYRRDLFERAKRVNGGSEKPQRDLIAYLVIDRNLGTILVRSFFCWVILRKRKRRKEGARGEGKRFKGTREQSVGGHVHDTRKENLPSIRHSCKRTEFIFLATFSRILLLSTGRCSGGRNG